MASRLRRFDIRQSSRHLALAAGALLVVNIAAYVFLVQPAVAEYERLRTVSGPRFDELNERRRQVEEQEGFLQAVRKAEEDLARLRDEVLATRQQRMVDVQSEIHDLAEQFGINYESVTYSNALLGGEGLDRMEIGVPLEGGYANLRRFIQAVENSDKFLIVERVALAEGKQGGALLQLNITLATYFSARPDAQPATLPR